MGQSQSDENQQLTQEEITHLITVRLQKRTFKDIELYSFRDVFFSLAEHSDGVAFWSEDTLTRFLELPDALDVGALIFHASSAAASFPFISIGPTILEWEGMVRALCVFTGRYKGVLKKGVGDPVRLWFKVLSVYDRGEEEEMDTDPAGKGDAASSIITADTATTTETAESTSGTDDLFAVADPEDMEEDDDDDLALAALDALDAIEVFKHAEKSSVKYIQRLDPQDMIKFVMLLLVVAPLDPQESLATYVERYSADALPDLRRTAESIVRSMSTASQPILWSAFNRSVRRSLPYMFDGLKPLYEHFLFSRRLSVGGETRPQVKLPPRPLLQHLGAIMTNNVLNQLSFFLNGKNLWRRLRKLYIGSEDGFSMGSFEQKVFKWRAPTILLVSGSRMPATPETSREKSFTESLAPKRFPDSVDADGGLIFGAYVDVPWKISHKECFGSSATKIFQLHPIHEVFKTSHSHTDYAYWNRSAGVGFGAPLPRVKAGEPVLHMNLGAVSLVLDESLEFGIFTHSSDGGGAYHTSDLPVNGRRDNWQDRFAIEEIEVWGLGGEAEAKEQARQWAWDEAEALRRRSVNLGNDLEANRALLEMAGIIGGDRSGGSM
ncbi:Restriction of telomere capping protein 5 [Orbilia brochopaga]|uniref:Restriction of telomere capping protein 5 n=1 Tax=Orbilia brochopaga TaxID=3140254 RepID=A0AAV9UEI1_9PEZI